MRRHLCLLTWYPLPRVARYVRPEAVADDVDLGGVQPQNLHQPRHLQAHQPGHRLYRLGYIKSCQ